MPMKMKPEHVERLRKLTEPLLATPGLVENYEEGKFPGSDKVRDLQVRFCWDVLYHVDRRERQALFDELYLYLDDTHITTALKRLCPAVERRY